MRIYKAGMGFLTISLIALAALGCERIIGLHELEVEDEIEGVDGPCTVVLFEMANMEGKCVHRDAPPEDCPGGTVPGDESGDCPNPDKLKCCIKEDQCEKYSAFGLWCDEQSCPDEGWKMGCPDGQWCCDMMVYEE